MGDRSALTLWSDKPEVHRVYADQLTKNEYAPLVESHGRKIVEFKPFRNHLVPGTAGCFVAASMLGVGIEA